MQVREHGHKLPGQPAALAIRRRTAAKFDLEIQDHQRDDGQQDKRDDGERIRNPLKAPGQFDKQRNHSQSRRGNHQIHESLDADRPEDSPDGNPFGIGQEIAAQDFARP